MTIRPSADTAAARISAARTLLAEIDRTCRTLRANPRNGPLARRCVEGLAGVVATSLLDGPLECRLLGGRVLLEGSLVLEPRDDLDPFVMLAEAGVRSIVFDAPLADPDNLIAFVDLLGHRIEDRTEITRRVWSATIPGAAFREGEGDLEQSARAESIRWLGQLPAGAPPPELDATVEREIAAEPVVRTVGALLARLSGDRELRAHELEFVARVLQSALAEREIDRAARILDAVERCPHLGASHVDELRDRARQVCGPSWWQQVAEAAHDQDRASLAAFLLELGVEPEAADRILQFGAPAAVSALLQTAPDAPSTAALRQAIHDRPELRTADSLRRVLARRTESV